MAPTAVIVACAPLPAEHPLGEPPPAEAQRSPETIPNPAITTADGPTADGPSAAPADAPSDVPVAAPEAARASAGETQAPQGWIGIGMKQTDDGVLVADVFRSGPAAAAGLKVGDRLLRINARVVATPSDVSDLVRGLAPGTQVSFDVRRGGETRLLAGQIEVRPDRDQLIRREFVGFPAPSISELQTVSGSVVPSWTQLRGHVVVLEFWASWCVACRALAPTLNDWHADLGPLGVHILGVTMDPYEEAARASAHLGYPVFSDEDGQVTQRFQGTALPTLFIVDKQGVIAEVMVGLNFERLPELEQRVRALASASQ